jgi:hypothetical protein
MRWRRKRSLVRLAVFWGRHPHYLSRYGFLNICVAAAVKTSDCPTSRAPAVANSIVLGQLTDPLVDPAAVVRASVPSVGWPDRRASSPSTRWLVWGCVATALWVLLPNLSQGPQPLHRLRYARLRQQPCPRARLVAAVGHVPTLLVTNPTGPRVLDRNHRGTARTQPARFRGASGAGRPAAALA